MTSIRALLLRSTAHIRLSGLNRPLVSMANAAPPEDIDENVLEYSEFIEKLRRFSKKSIVDVGSVMLWFAYSNPKWRRENQQEAHLLHSYGAKIIVLAMAVGTDHRDEIVTPAIFNELCHDYLGIPCSLTDETFLDNEAREITALLNDVIPAAFLNLEHIRSSCLELSLTRLIRSQHEVSTTGMQELLSAYKIFTILDRRMDGAATAVCQRVFQISPLHFFRSGFMLFALANADGKNGRVIFENLTEEQSVVEKYQIDVQTCRLVASKISYHESALRAWHEDEVMAVDSLYLKFFPNPLYRHPLIHRDGRRRDIDFLIPAPGLFIRGFVKAFLFEIFAYAHANEINMSSHYGDAVEEHIFGCLQAIFGADNVERITGTGIHADFKLKLPNCDLIVETKTTLGKFLAQSIMTPEHIKTIWKLLYEATQQCAASIAAHRSGTRPIYGLVIIAEHMTMEAAPYTTFAERSGLFGSLGVEGIEFLSWTRMENVLSNTSIQKFEEAFLKKWRDKARMTVADAMSFTFERDNPAHSYEYLEAIEQEIFRREVLALGRPEEP